MYTINNLTPLRPAYGHTPNAPLVTLDKSLPANPKLIPPNTPQLQAPPTHHYSSNILPTVPDLSPTPASSHNNSMESQSPPRTIPANDGHPAPPPIIKNASLTAAEMNEGLIDAAEQEIEECYNTVNNI